MMVLRLFIYGLILVVGVYLFASLLARKFKKIHLSRALLYIASVAMIGVLGEITVDATYAHFFSTPLWRYNFLPVHHAYTSGFAPILWGSLGFYIYLIHHSYEKWPPRHLLKLTAFFGLEAMALEAVIDIIAKYVLGDLIFYYYPNGLWHISAFQNFPFYFICGAIVVLTIHHFKTKPHFFIFVSMWVTAVTVYL